MLETEARGSAPPTSFELDDDRELHGTVGVDDDRAVDGLPADRRARHHRRPPHDRARRHRRARSTGTAARASTRRASSAAILDARARRLLPHRARATTTGSPKQLYFPDTNVLITRFLTPAGVGEVQDFMPIASGRGRAPPPADPARARRPRRDALPRRRGAPLRLRRASSTRPSFTRTASLFRSPAALARARDSRAARTSRRTAACGEFTLLPRRDGDVRARAGARDVRPAHVLRGGDAGGVRGDRRVLAPLARRSRRYQGRWREMRQPLGADAEAADVPADRRDRRRADDEPARAASAAGATGTTATRGSATPRSRSTRCCASASPRRRRAFMDWLTERFREERRGRRRAAADHVRDRRPARARRRRSSGTSRATAARARPDRQRRRRPAPARHLRRADRLGLPLQQVRARRSRTTPWMDLTRIVDWVCENWDQADEGIWEVRGGRQHFTYSRLMSWVAIERADADRYRSAGFRRELGALARVARRDLPPDHGRAAGTTSGRRSSSTTTTTRSTRASS